MFWNYILRRLSRVARRPIYLIPLRSTANAANGTSSAFPLIVKFRHGPFNSSAISRNEITSRHRIWDICTHFWPDTWHTPCDTIAIISKNKTFRGSIWADAIITNKIEMTQMSVQHQYLYRCGLGEPCPNRRVGLRTLDPKYKFRYENRVVLVAGLWARKWLRETLHVLSQVIRVAVNRCSWSFRSSYFVFNVRWQSYFLQCHSNLCRLFK